MMKMIRRKMLRVTICNSFPVICPPTHIKNLIAQYEPTGAYVS